MFGSTRDNQQQTMDPAQDQGAPAPVDGFLPAATPAQNDGTSVPQPTDPMVSNGAPEVASQLTPDVPPADYIMTDAPAEDTSVAVSVNNTPEPTEPEPAPLADGVSDDLLALKQQALQQLAPLVGQLDQSPEDKFRTTMMMLQSTDDQSLIRVAYDAAQTISDEKIKAQALLDVINEINYFTKKNS